MNERLTLQDLTDLLAAKHGMTKKDAEAFVKEFFLLIEKALAKEKYVKIKGLGTFKLIEVDSRESVNVNTGERFQIGGHTKVSFSPDANLRDTINKPFAHFETVVLNDNTVLEDTPIDDEEATEEGSMLDEAVIEEKNITEKVTGDAEEPIVISENETKQTSESLQKQETKPENVIEEVIKEQSKEEVIEQPAESINEKVQYTAEQIIKQELQKVNLKLDTPPIQPEIIKPESNVRIDETKKEKSAVPFLVTIIVIVLLLCGSAILFIYYPDLFSSSSKDKLDMPTTTQSIQPETQLADSIEKKDTITNIKFEEPKEKIQQQTIKKDVEPTIKQDNKLKNESLTPVYSDTAIYSITGTKATHTIKEGETLTKVALQYYGTKALWPYIVKHNAGVIKNPDNVPYGTSIKIPELTKK